MYTNRKIIIMLFLYRKGKIILRHIKSVNDTLFYEMNEVIIVILN